MNYTPIIYFIIIIALMALILFFAIQTRRKRIKKHNEELARREAIKKSWGLDKSIKNPRQNLLILKRMASDFLNQRQQHQPHHPYQPHQPHHLKKEKEEQIMKMGDFNKEMDNLLYSNKEPSKQDALRMIVRLHEIIKS